ncbi:MULTISPECIES: hypothetical protein [unclassified Microcoleus]|uniref:hypothetical protein n=1 Tax=unclassified Microcoleus TaxID=2642155 RepID=UPI002FCE70BB
MEQASCLFLKSGQDAHPTRKTIFVEQASCLFLKSGQDAHPTRKTIFVEQASCLFLKIAKSPFYKTYFSCGTGILPVPK